MGMKEFFADKKKRNAVIIGSSALALALVVGVGATVFAVQKNDRSKRYNSMVKTARKDMTDLDYEEAIAVYEEAIELDPKNAKAYIGLADAYAKQGDIDAAKKVLKDAEKNVDKNQIPDIEDAKKKLEKDPEPVATTPAPTTPAPITPDTTPVPDETDPPVESTIITTPVPVEIPEVVIPEEELYIAYIEKHADDFGGFSTIGAIKGESTFFNDGGEYILPELSELADSLSGVATYALSDVDGDGKNEAIVVSYDKNVENNDSNEYTAVVKLTVLDVQENITVVASKSENTVLIGKSSTHLGVYTGNISGKYAVAVTTDSESRFYEISSDAVTLSSDSFSIDGDSIIYENNFVFEAVDDDANKTLKFESYSGEYVDTSELSKHVDRGINPVAEVKNGAIALDSASMERYPQLVEGINAACGALDGYATPDMRELTIIRSDASAFSFVARITSEEGTVSYLGYTINTNTGHIYTPDELCGDPEAVFVATPDCVAVIGAAEVSFIPFPDAFEAELTYDGTYMYNVQDWVPYTNDGANLSIQAGGQNVQMDSSKLDPSTVTITLVQSYSGKCIYVAGKAVDGSGAYVYRVTDGSASSHLELEVNPFDNFVGHPERFSVANNVRIASFNGREIFAIVDDGDIKSLGIAPAEGQNASALALEDAMGFNYETGEFEIAENQTVQITLITDDYVEAIADDGTLLRFDISDGIEAVLKLG